MEITPIIQLIVLFFVIFDPPASLAVFLVSTQHVDQPHRNRIASLAVLLAYGLSLAVLAFGLGLLDIFNTSLDDFRVAGGVVLGLLGIKMAMGGALISGDSHKGNAKAIAAIIATPLLTGPAAITSIIIAVNDYGHLITWASFTIVLGITAILFYQASFWSRFIGRTSIQVMSTILGLVTIAWGVKFIRAGLGI